MSAQPAVDPGRENHPPPPEGAGPVPGISIPSPVPMLSVEETIACVQYVDYLFPPGYAEMFSREIAATAREAERTAGTVLDWGLPDLDLLEEVTDLESVPDDELIAMLRYFYKAQLQANARRLFVIAGSFRRRAARELSPTKPGRDAGRRPPGVGREPRLGAMWSPPTRAGLLAIQGAHLAVSTIQIQVDHTAGT